MEYKTSACTANTIAYEYVNQISPNLFVPEVCMILRREFNWFTHENPADKLTSYSSGLEFFEKVDAKDKTFKSWEGLYHECMHV
jgi:hypothetical protein